MKQINTEIVIIGGGSAGVAAAVSAAKSGKSVVLIDSHRYLGGSATASEVGTICGLFHQQKTTIPTYIVKGFAKDFAEKLKSTSNMEPIFNRDGLHFLPYSIEAYKTICNDYLEQFGVELFLESKIVDIDISNGIAKSCVIIQNEQVLTLNFEAIIDCSGKSIVSKLSNVPLIESKSFQSAAMVFSMNNVYIENESSLNLLLIKNLSTAISSGNLTENFRKVFLVPGSLKNGNVSFKVGIPLEVTLSKDNVSELKNKGLQMIETLVKFLTSEVTIFTEANLDHIAEDVGIRTDYRSEGQYILTEQDVLTCRKFENSVADCSWPIEEWGNELKVKMDFLPENDFYQIPAECLKSKHIGNLFFGGKNISATDRAIASARVMGICFQTGYASGNLASEYVSSNSKKAVEAI